MPDQIDISIDLSLENRYAEAVKRVLLVNPPLNEGSGTFEGVDGKVTRHNPENIDEFISAPQIMVWPDVTQSLIRPQPGDYARPLVTVVVFLVTHMRTRAIVDLDLDPVDVLLHCQKILERGTATADNAMGEVGRLFDPTLVNPNDPLIPDIQRFLNRNSPKFNMRSKRLIPKTKTTGWPLLVTYETSSTRQERRPAP